MQLPVFGVVGAVAVGLQLGLLGQMLCLRGWGLLRAGYTGAEPQMAAQMVAHTQLLFGLVQPFRRVEGAPETAFDVGAVLRGVLLQGDVCPALVHGQPAACGIHRTGVFHCDPVSLDHLGGHGPGGKGGQKAVQMQVQGGFLPDLAVKKLEFCVDG